MNLQLNMNDDEYCRQVNAGTYRYKDYRTARESFAHDTGGFGLAQWTLSSRKDELYTRTVGSGKPVEDLSVQCGLAWAELIRDFPGVYKLMHNSSDLRACTVEFLFKFENPAVKSADVQNLRTKYAQNIYDAFHGVPVAAPEKPSREKQLIAEIRERLDELEGLANA